MILIMPMDIDAKTSCHEFSVNVEPRMPDCLRVPMSSLHHLQRAKSRCHMTVYKRNAP